MWHPFIDSWNLIKIEWVQKFWAVSLLWLIVLDRNVRKFFPEVEESISKMITNANIENVYRIIRNRNKLRFAQKWAKVRGVPKGTVVLD